MHAGDGGIHPKRQRRKGAGSNKTRDRSVRSRNKPSAGPKSPHTLDKNVQSAYSYWTQCPETLEPLPQPDSETAMNQSKKRPREGKDRLRPTMESLRVLVELADKISAAAKQGANYSSPSAAAKALGSKANVLRVLDELKEVYGRRLVKGSPVTLTPEGEAVYAWAKTLLQLHAKGTKWPIGQRELIRIGTSNWILNFLMPEIVRAFLEKRAKLKTPNAKVPELDLVFAEYDVEQLLVDLRKGTVHAGLAAILASGPWPGLDVQTLRKDVGTVMIASSQHERWGENTRKSRTHVMLDEIAEETVCVIEADLYTVLPGLREQKKVGNRILVENYASVISLVRTVVAVGFIPQLDIGRQAGLDTYQGLEVYHLKEPTTDQTNESSPSRTLAILRRSGETLPAEVEAFLRIAEEKLAEVDRKGARHNP